MTIYLGSDHAGFVYKERAKKLLSRSKVTWSDFGPLELDPTDDYPKVAEKVAKVVAKTPGSLGILFCGSGVGMCIAANKIKGIRAANVHTVKEGRQSKEHNNANVLCLGQTMLSWRTTARIIKAWLDTPFSHEPRHHRRVKQLDALLR